MTFQAKNNRNAAKRIYNLNSLNNPIILDLLKSQEGKFSGYSNSFTSSNLKSQHTDDKSKLLSITGKQVVCQSTFTRSNNKQHNRQNIQLTKNIQQIKLMLQQPIQNYPSLIEGRQQSRNSILNVQNYQSAKVSSEKFLSPQLNMQKYYQNVILNDPLLYNKVVSAYKTLQRKVNSKQKTEMYVKKRFSTNKISSIDKLENINLRQKPKLFSKISENDAKNEQQRKKFLFFNIYRQFQLLVNLSNSFIMIPQSQGQYKAFIGKGNNGLLIKSIVKSRPWWCIRTVSDLENCNLIWTQWKKQKYMKILPSSKYQKSNYSEQSPEKTVQKQIHNFKLKLISKILPQNKINQLYSKLDLKSDEQITKYNKKISDPSFPILVQKVFSKLQRKNVNKNSKLVNHIPGCFQLHSKKLLFANLKKYYQRKSQNVWNFLPQTYVISKGLNDYEYQKFLEGWQKHQQQKDNKTNRNIWICKPGQNSNRGNGITVASSLNEIKNFITSHSSSNGMCSALIQKYMENPFLYNKRKFDIRCYILITTSNGIVKGYWYEEGYIRTTSKEYNLKNLDNKFVHLTNDAIQKKGETYGKFQNFNKISFPDFQKYLDQNYPNVFNFKNTLQKMKQMATDLINSVGRKLNPDKKQYSFQLFGLDFMLDDKLEAFIIQANSNPCIQVEGNVLGRVIPSMLQNMIRVAIDPIFPPPYSQNIKNTKYSPGNVIEQNKFTLVYDSLGLESFQQEEIITTKEEQEQQRMLEAQIQRQNQEQN